MGDVCWSSRKGLHLRIRDRWQERTNLTTSESMGEMTKSKAKARQIQKLPTDTREFQLMRKVEYVHIRTTSFIEQSIGNFFFLYLSLRQAKRVFFEGSPYGSNTRAFTSDLALSYYLFLLKYVFVMWISPQNIAKIE